MAHDPSKTPADAASPEPVRQGRGTGAAQPAQPLGWARWTLAVAVAMAGVVFLCGFVHWYETDIFAEWGPGNRTVIVYALAPFVFFMALVVLLLNAPLRRFAPALGLDRRQMALIAGLWLMTGAICHANLVMPVLHAAGQVRGQAYAASVDKAGMKQFLPEGLYLSADEARAYYQGMSEDTRRIPVSKVPWKVWAGPLKFWGPFMLVIAVLSIALVRTMHRQWSQHELLTYPIAEFGDAMVGLEEGRSLPSVFYDRGFWIGFGGIFFIYLINGIRLWAPQMVEIPMSFSHIDLVKEFPFLSKYCGREAYSLFRATVYPAVAALAALLPAEISLSAWLGWALMILGTGVYFLASGEMIGPEETTHMSYGMYAALFCMLAYIGRREYGRILWHAFAFRRTDDDGLRRGVRACRVFVLAFAVLTAMLVMAGFSPALALAMTGVFSLIVALAARMTAEMGMPWLVSLSGVGQAVPLTVLGAAALGPRALTLLAVIGSLLTADMSNSVAAQETTICRLRERSESASRGIGFNAALVVALLLALAASVFFILWDNYSFGAQREARGLYGWSNAVKAHGKEIERLKTQGVLDGLKDTVWPERLQHIKLPDKFGRHFFMGAVLIAGCAFMRLRFTWWPIHPLPLLFFGTWAMSRMYFSFLLGWLIKVIILRTGGGRVFARLKPFFLGVIGGQIAVAGCWTVFNAVYFLVTGNLEADKLLRMFV